MLLLSLLVETGQRPGAGLTQAEKTCIQLNFYILKGGTWVSRGGGGKKKTFPLNATLKYNDYAVLLLISLLLLYIQSCINQCNLC